MHQNFKTDIIYYNTATDFELEFNLCGCCRMRLFNDKCSDKKTLLTSLSRAFARSRIIILTAPLFDGTNIIKSISSAIGKEVETVDTTAFNINSNEPIEITKGAIPLVTADGIFGGCIIESGPQTLIILTDNKSIRKNIMVSLIHPYIEEISIGGKPQSAPQPIDTEEIITEQDDEPVEEAQEPELDPEEMVLTLEDDDDDSAEETSENDSDYYEEELLTDVEDDSDPEEDAPEYSEGDTLITDSSEPETEDSDDEPEYYENDYYVDDVPEEKNSAFNIALIIICSILLIAIVVLCYCIFFIPAQNETTPAIYLKEIYDTMFK